MKLLKILWAIITGQIEAVREIRTHGLKAAINEVKSIYGHGIYCQWHLGPCRGIGRYQAHANGPWVCRKHAEVLIDILLATAAKQFDRAERAAWAVAEKEVFGETEINYDHNVGSQIEKVRLDERQKRIELSKTSKPQ